MNAACSSLFSIVRRSWRSVFLAPLGAVLVALAACNGTAVVTMTSTASTDNFLAYRVDLVSVQLLTSGGSSGLTVLPASTIVDFATLTNMDEVLGAAQVSKGTYTSAVITLDYSSAQIIYDNGSLNGVSLTPVNALGQHLGLMQITVTLDPNNSFSVASKGASLLAMDFNMAASNLVDLANNTVVVTPLIAASSLPIDSKQVRIRGPVHNVSGSGTTSSTSSTTTPYGSTPSTTTTTGSFTMGAMPFNSNTSGGGTLSITPTAATTYEINGKPAVGGTGESLLAGLSSGSLAIAYGTLTATDETSTTTQTTTAQGTLEDNIATSTVVTFTATQVLGGSSVQGAGLDRVTGVVTARSGNTLELQDATLVGADGSDTFILGTTQVTIGPNTVITEFGQSTGTYTPAQVSVGSSIDAFGILTSQSSGNATMDASAGRVRLDITTASGLVTVQGSGTLTLNLSDLGGRAVGATAPFVFTGSGATAGQYVVGTGTLDLSNSAVGAPVLVTGLTSSFTGTTAAATPNFTATTLLDPTTINATLVLDWSAGTTTPFAAFNSSGIDVDIANVGIGVRHEIQVGAQLINLLTLSSDPQIVPSTTTATPNAVFTIGHSLSSTTENFDTFIAFITQVQSELNGSVLATGVTAVGQYSSSSFTLTASSITLFLDN
jgi:hypothetical protein